MSLLGALKSGRSAISTVLNEPSNAGDRARRLLMSTGWQLWKRVTSVPLVLTLDNGLLFIADPTSGNSSGAIYTKIYESIYTEFVRKAVPPGGVLCDIGAHVGLFTLLIAPSFRGGYCFEPADDSRELLRRNLALNGLSAFQIRSEALSSKSGTSRFVADGPLSGTARLVDEASPDPTTSSRSKIVRTLRLDDALPPDEEIAFVKIDVEGFEPDVLLGAEGVLNRSRRGMLMFEQNAMQAAKGVAIVRKLGWRPFLLDDRGVPTSNLEAMDRVYNIFACGPDHAIARSI